MSVTAVDFERNIVATEEIIVKNGKMAFQLQQGRFLEVLRQPVFVKSNRVQ